MKTTRNNLLPLLLLFSAIAVAISPAFGQEKPATPAPTPSPIVVTATAPTKSVARGVQKIEREGVEVEFTIEPVAGAGGQTSDLMEAKEASVRFKIIDKATKTPLSGVKPSVWLTQRAGGETTSQQCREKVQSFLQGSLRSRPDVDLNAYYLLALNQEANISVIDPLLGFGSSKLLTLVMLKSPGGDWAQSAKGERLYVSMPLVNQVAVVDTTTWKVVANIDAGAKPTRVRLQPDEKYLWVGNDATAAGEQGGVTVIDTATLKVVARVATGEGHHEFAFGNNNQFAFVTNGESGTLSVVDIQKLAKVGDVKTGASITSVDYSPLANALYVVNGVEGTLTVVNTRNQQVAARIQLKPGASIIRFAPGGRWGFVTNPSGNVVNIFDASTNRLKHTVTVEKGPDQVAFTDAFAYIRSTGSTEITMIRLSTVGDQPDIVKFPGGQAAPEQSPDGVGVADVIVPAPEGNSVLVANPADRVIYYYSEGMAAPMGSFQNYRRNPRAVMVVDRSLREVTTGVYATTTKLPKSGIYDVAFLLDSPRITHCFETEAKTNPEIRRERQTALRIEYLNEKKMIRVGENYKLRFKLTETAAQKPMSDLRDVRVLTFLAPGIWQKRDFARSVGGGVYELDINVPETGVYLIFVESQSQGVTFRQLPYLTVQATEANAAQPAK
jgi:YVTN family beta-propeller protein